jgi:uncharacterized membrane protein
VPLSVLYPGVCLRAPAPEAGSKYLDFGLVVIAVAVDLLLLGNIAFAEHRYFLVAWNMAASVVIAWLALWAGWQILAVVSLRKRRPTRTA